MAVLHACIATLPDVMDLLQYRLFAQTLVKWALGYNQHCKCTWLGPDPDYHARITVIRIPTNSISRLAV